MYQAFENNKPCDTTGFPQVHKSWKNSKFKTFKQASKYLNHWMGYITGYGKYPIKFTIKNSLFQTFEIEDVASATPEVEKVIFEIRKVK